MLAFVGVVALICNTEDDQHGDRGLINAIESAAIALTLAWGSILVRAGGRYVEFAQVLEKDNPILYDVQM